MSSHNNNNMRIKNRNNKRKKKNDKSNNSGASVKKRPKTSSRTVSDDDSEIIESEKSDALAVIPLPVITKADMAAVRRRQGRAKQAECRSPPCIAILYTRIERKWVKGKGWVGESFVPTGVSITFTSRTEAGDKFGGMKAHTISRNINKKGISKIKGGDYDGLYVMLSNKPVESIMFEGKEIKPPPPVPERVKGDKYVHNGIVRIWNGHSYWNCVEHNKNLGLCVKCSGASICPCGIHRFACREHRVQPLLECTECQHTCVSAKILEEHMRTHTGEKPHKCDHCSFRSATNSTLTSHEGWIHDIGNEQCTNCHKNCYRPRSWIATTEEEQYCKECYQDRFGVNFREEQEWSDWLDERFYPEFRTGTNTRISMCTLFFPDGLSSYTYLGLAPRFFCSEVVIAALKAGAILDESVSTSMHPNELYKLVKENSMANCARSMNSVKLSFV